jgi:hypothetical protein
VRVDEAKAALQRAGYVVELAHGRTTRGIAEPVSPLPPTPFYDVGGLGRDLTEAQLIQLAHRHGAWSPAFERAHSAGPPG